MCADKRSQRLPRPPLRRGLSIVEMMIGLVIGLMVCLAAMNSAITFGATQRQAAVTGGGAMSATGALAAIKGDVAVAGLGFFGESLYLCNTLNLSNGTTLVSNGASFAPLQLSRSNGNDQVDIIYGDQVAAGASVLLRSASDGTSAELMSMAPLAAGQAVLLAPASAGRCTVRSVTASTAAAATAPQVVSFGATGAYNQGTFTTAPAYAARDRLSVLGRLQWHRYRVTDGNLVMEQPLAGTSAVLARNVVAFRAEYGVSTAAGTPTLASWQAANTSGWGSLSNTNIGRVRAIRLGLLVRSAQREKPAADGTCSATATMPTLLSDSVTADVTDWFCYRFRSVTLVVPLRNLVWGQAGP
jgi:type IV pilus assembly protein PilW